MADNYFTDLVSDEMDSFERAVKEAVHAGPDGDAALASALEHAREEWQPVMLITALGEANGAKGAESIRREASNPRGDSDRRCAALVAAVKRLGEDASDLFADLLEDSDQEVRRYARVCMACVGDGRASRDMLIFLDAALAGPPRDPFSGPSEQMLALQTNTLPIVIYLARHANDESRRTLVVEKLRGGWDRLFKAEQEWLRLAWPQCAPDFEGSDSVSKAPDTDSMVRWLGTPLLQPLYEH